MTRSLFDDQEPPAAGARDDVPVGAGTPLAERLRPRDLDAVVGHASVVGPGAFLRRAVEEGRVPSLIFWGPPGTGKTTLARILAATTELRFVPFSAVTSGIKEVREVMKEASRLRQATGRRTLLFVDEIHRFNRAQQDAFLPWVERGDIVLVGATTENPSFELVGALLSRCRVVVLEPLSVEDVVELLERALADAEHGLGDAGVEVEAEALEEIAQLAGGDARRALNLLEQVVADADPADPADPADVDQDHVDQDHVDQDGAAASVDRAAVARVAQRKVLFHDKAGDEHYHLLSALHKSLRESDPDAALYWLARMLEAGEEPLVLARRMVRFANEDVGLAEPRAVQQALAAWDAYHRLGSPEGDLALAQAAVYLALAPKSDRLYAAFERARDTVRRRPADPVPPQLRNAPTRLAEEVGWGEGYVHAHGEEEGVGGMECLPDSLAGERFYRPHPERGFEGRLAERLERLRSLRRGVRERRRDPDAG